MVRALKVFRTPIGFHDAYVAAPSQKAALEAWGSDANLFARGVAEVVTAAELTEEPLANPGKVIKRLRGSAEDHFQALPSKRQREPAKPAKIPKPASKRRATPKKVAPKPSRTKLSDVEDRLTGLQADQRVALNELEQRERALRAERKRLEAAQARERARLEAQVSRVRDAYDAAIEKWRDDL